MASGSGSGSLKRELYLYALHDMWNQAEPVFRQFSEMLRIPLTASGDTALHVAVSANNVSFVKGLVNLMTPEDLNIPNSDGMLPVHLAALTGNRDIVQDLCSQNWLHEMDSKDIERLFFMTISSSMFGNVEALKWLLSMNPKLVTIKDPHNKGHNLLQFAVVCRQRCIFYFILKMGTRSPMLQAVDNDRNNVLHLAARQHQGESSLISNIQMELLIWFKELEKRVPPEFRTMRNIDGKTPNDILYDKPKKLSKQATERAKGMGGTYCWRSICRSSRCST